MSDTPNAEMKDAEVFDLARKDIALLKWALGIKDGDSRDEHIFCLRCEAHGVKMWKNDRDEYLWRCYQCQAGSDIFNACSMFRGMGQALALKHVREVLDYRKFQIDQAKDDYKTILEGVKKNAENPVDKSFEKEIETWNKNKDRLSICEGKFVWICGEEISNPFDSYPEAFHSGNIIYGIDKFIVKKIEAVETKPKLTRGVPVRINTVTVKIDPANKPLNDLLDIAKKDIAFLKEILGIEESNDGRHQLICRLCSTNDLTYWKAISGEFRWECHHCLTSGYIAEAIMQYHGKTTDEAIQIIQKRYAPKEAIVTQDQHVDVEANGEKLGLTKNCVAVLKTRYLKKDPTQKCVETPEDLFRRVARVVAAGEAKYGASQEVVDQAAEQYYELMVKGIFMPNSPTLMNAGREINMLSACFVLPLEDSIADIFETVKNTALIQKAGGGTGFTLDRLRPTGDWIKSSGGTTSGPISFWKVLCEATNAIQQGCFVAGTLIATPDGPKPIEKICSGDLVWTYATKDQAGIVGHADCPDGPIVLTASSAAWLTKEDSPVWKLTTDQGTEVFATPDHLIMLENGKYKKLSLLKEGDSLMPLHAVGSGVNYEGKSQKVSSVAYSHVEDVYDFEVGFTHNFYVVDESGNGFAVHNSRRRGANMMMASIDIPDILKFIFAKQDLSNFQNYNISVKVPDAWMRAFRSNPEQPNLVTNKRGGQSYVLQKDLNIEQYQVTDLMPVEKYLSMPESDRPSVWRMCDIWDTIVQNAWKTGEPGVVFIDRVREDNPTPNVGEIEASNPCVAGETLVAVADGRGCVPIRQLAEEGKDIPVHCVDPETGDAKVRMGRHPRITGIKQKLFRVVLDDGSFIRVTENHKFILRDGTKKMTHELKNGDSLMSFIRRQEPNTTAGKLYWVIATRGVDRSYYHEHNMIARFFHGDRDGDYIPHHLNSNGLDNRPENLQWVTRSEHSKIDPRISMRDGANNGMYGKIHSETTKSKIGAKTSERLSTPEQRKAHGEAVRAGITEEMRAKLRQPRVERISVHCAVCGKELKLIPSAFREKLKYGPLNDIRCSRSCSNARIIDKEEIVAMGVECIKKCGKLTDKSWQFSYNAIRKDRPSVGFLISKFGSFASFKEQCKEIYNHEVVSVYEDGCEDVFNITVDEFHTVSYVTDENARTKHNNHVKHWGITTCNCGEQFLLSKECCNLGSVNLGLFCGKAKEDYDWARLRRVVHLSTRFLENIVEVNNYIVPEIDKICRENRKIGLGIMGFADALFKMNIGYNTDEGVAWGERFMKFVNDEAHNESEKLSEERGVFANWKGSRWDKQWKRKQRNACSTTVAPTGTISIISNCSGGIEPLFSLAFFRHVMRDHTGKAQQMVEVNEAFKALAKANNFWGYSEHELFDRLATEGSLHHIPNIPEAVKHTFVCAHDISPEWHVKMQAAFQKHVDNAISKTTNFPNSATPDDVRKIYDLAFETGCKGVTVYRDGCRKGQPMALKKEEAPVKEVIKEVIREVVHITPQKTPAILSAVRIRSNTPFGHMHLTISVDPKSERELEVFAQLGKAGDIAASDLEAICRMVSLFLRSGGSLEQVVNQLEGIGSSLSTPTKEGRVGSLGDAMGKSIKRYLQAKKKVGLKSILLGEADFENDHSRGILPVEPVVEEGKSARLALPHVSEADQSPRQKDGAHTAYKVKCPDCGSTLAFMEGCEKCIACGYSKC